MCVIALVAVAPCQCFSPGGNQTISPGLISSIGPPSRCTQPQPKVTIRVCPSGCVCHAVREPGSNVTLAPATRAGLGAVNSGSTRTGPVNQSAGPLPEGFEPLRVISIARGPLVVSEQACCALLALQPAALQSSLSGVTGSSRMCLPVAWYMAFVIAGATPTMA